MKYIIVDDNDDVIDVYLNEDEAYDFVEEVFLNDGKYLSVVESDLNL